MRSLTKADFPIVAIGHNVYRKTESSPICTCVLMDMAEEIAKRLNRDAGFPPELAEADDLANGNHGF